MKIFFRYFVLEYKRSLKVLVKSIGSLVFMMVFTVAGVLTVSHILFQSGMFQKVEVGVVIPESEQQTKLVARFISSMDSVRSICDFQYFGQEEAMQRLQSGEVQAVISLPESFYDDIYMGRQAHTTVYFPKDAALNVKVFGELLGDGVSLLRTAEAGVFASMETAEKYEIPVESYEVADISSYAYIWEAFKRSELYENFVSSPLGQMNLYQYYFVAAMSVLLLMCGLNYSFLYQRQTKTVEQKLRIMGMDRWKLSAVKVVIMAAFLWALQMLLYLAVCAASWLTERSFVWFDWRALLWMLPFCICLAAYFHMIYAVAGNGVQGTVCLLAVNIWMIVASGAVVPSVYLPGWIAKVGAYSPLNFWNQYLADMVFFEVGVTDMLQMACLSVFGIVTGAMFSCRDTEFGTHYS